MIHEGAESILDDVDKDAEVAGGLVGRSSNLKDRTRLKYVQGRIFASNVRDIELATLGAISVALRLRGNLP
jgi:hypothetical protein